MPPSPQYASASDLRIRAAEEERKGDQWQRWANQAFEGGHAIMGQAYSDRAAWHYGRVSELGERAAVLEARWPEDTAGELFTQQIGARL